MKLYFGPNTDRPVTTATDVHVYLEEDKKHQYQDGYSMAEAAKSWVSAGGYLPSSIAAILGSNDLTAAHFEYPTKVWGRGTAMTDVLAFVPNSVIAVEAKVDEPFDDVVSDWIEREAKRNPRSPPHRQKVIQRYAKALTVDPQSLLGVRYQLFAKDSLCLHRGSYQGLVGSVDDCAAFSPRHRQRQGHKSLGFRRLRCTCREGTGRGRRKSSAGLGRRIAPGNLDVSPAPTFPDDAELNRRIR